MHARRKGKASSKRPMITENPDWVPLSATEIEDKIEAFANEGMSPAMIGMVLRDQYAVPNYLTGRQINARLLVEF